MRDATRGAALLWALGVLTGCTPEDSLPDPGLVPTAVSVDPQIFLGDVPCGPSAGSMRSFVAIVTDRGPYTADPAPAGYPFVLPASRPTPCSEIAAFRYVVADHAYSARVEAYEQPAETLVPTVLGCNPEGANGSKQLCVEADDGQLTPAVPRWRTECAERHQPCAVDQDCSRGPCRDNGFCAIGVGAAIAANNADVKVRGCADLEDAGGETATAIAVDPSSALGALTCAGDEGGDVATLAILPDAGALPPVTGIPCGAKPAPYEEAIEPGKTYGFRIEARAEAEGPVKWASSCFSVPKEGIVNAATCDALTDRGGIVVSLEADDIDCPEGGVFDVLAAPQGEDVFEELGSFPCGAAATVNGVPAGVYELGITIRPKDADPTGATCTATVIPADTSAAVCEAD